MSDKQSRLYKLHDHITGDVAYLRAYTRAGARAYHCEDRFTVEPLSVDEALTLDKSDIVDATRDPQQQKLPNLDGVQTA